MKTTLTTLAAASFAIAVAGCGNPLEDPQEISEVSGSGAWIEINAAQAFPVGNTNIELGLHLQKRPGDACPVLTDRAKATVNGEPVRLNPGEGMRTPYDPTVICKDPILYAEVATAPGPTTIVISDDTGELRVTADLASPRTWSLSPEGQSELHVGEVVEMRWSNPADQLMAGKARAVYRPEVVPESAQALFFATDEIGISGAVLSFTIPNDWRFAPGAGELWLTADAQVQPSECLGVAACSLTFESHVGQPITVIAP